MSPVAFRVDDFWIRFQYDLVELAQNVVRETSEAKLFRQEVEKYSRKPLAEQLQSRPVQQTKGSKTLHYPSSIPETDH